MPAEQQKTKPVDEEEIVIVETPPEATDPPPAPPASNIEDDDDDDRLSASNVEEDGANDEERAAIRERRRLEKQERKQRRDEAIKRDKLEMDFLRKRNDDLERRLTAQEQRAQRADLNAFDAEIAKANQEAEMADKVIAKAVAAGNGEDVAQALKYREEAMQRARQLSYQKAQQAAQAANTDNRAPAIDPEVLSRARDFIGKNTWYDPQGKDEDSAIVLAIDSALNREGFDPKTDRYWEELEKRAAKRLPERFGGGTAPRVPRGGPALGSGRDQSAPPSRRTEVYITPERKQALIDAGVWDDPVLRAKYVKRYAEYDKQNRA